MYHFLNLFLLLVHLLLTAFNLFAWIWRPTRKAHLIVISLTLLSWWGLGLFYGFGYCPFTDWQWQIKRKLGETALPSSWIKYHVDLWFGVDSDPLAVDAAVAILTGLALAASVWMNWRDWKKRSI